MKNAEFLFHLVHSLSKRDKDNILRHAKVRAKRSDLKYLDLYRAILQQKEYDEAALKRRFGFSNFSEAKKHLSNLILRILRIYDEHPETQMQNRLAEIRILLDRSLYPVALKKIRQARRIAGEEERFDALRTLADYELAALPFVAKPRELQERREAVLSTRKAAFSQLDLIRNLKDLHDRELNEILDHVSQTGRFNTEMARALEQHALLHRPDEELPIRARSTKYRILNVIRHHQLDFAGRAEVLRRLIAIFDAHAFLIGEEPVRYVFALGAYGLCLNVTGRYAEALEATLRLRDFKSDKDNVRRAVFLNFATNLSTYTLNTGDVAPFRAQSARLLNALRQHRDSTPQPTLAYIRYLFAIVFWCADDMRRANRFARRVVEAPAGRTNLQAACKCFLLIFAWEQGDPDQIAQYARTWRRLWQKRPPEFDIERRFTDFMTRLVDVAGAEARVAALRKFRGELAEWLAGGFAVRADNFIFLVHWLDASLSGKGLAEVVAGKAEAQAGDK